MEKYSTTEYVGEDIHHLRTHGNL